MEFQNVLIVDDMPYNIYAMKMILKPLKHL
jgi:CheY-like chemotaxis protein